MRVGSTLPRRRNVQRVPTRSSRRQTSAGEGAKALAAAGGATGRGQGRLRQVGYALAQAGLHDVRDALRQAMRLLELLARLDEAAAAHQPARLDVRHLDRLLLDGELLGARPQV